MINMIRKLLSLAVILLFPVFAIAQTATISGTITDAATGEPLIGASVLVTELGTGASSNLDGEYTITNVPYGSYNLRISFVGYTTLRETIEVNQATIERNFELRVDPRGLEDVVVTSQAIERESRSLGYSISSVSGEEISAVRDASVISSLSGRVPGLDVTQQSGNLGGSTRIVLRGVSSLAGDNQPLFVVDGVPISNSNINDERLSGTVDVGNRANDINPDDIESVTVLRGAAAAALYGQRARNGVIMVTTKRGQDVPNANISINSSVQFSDVAKLPDFQNEFAAGIDGQYSTGLGSSWGPRIEGQEEEDFRGEIVRLEASPDNVRDFYDTGVNLINSVSISNADANSDYRLGFTSLNQTGIIPGAELDRFTLNFNSGTRLASNINARIGANYVTSTSEGRAVAGGNDPNVLTSLLNTLPRTVSNAQLRDYINPDGTQNPLTNFTNNPYWLVRENTWSNEVERLYGFALVEYNPYEWLGFSARFGTDGVTETRRRINRPGTIGREGGGWTDNTIIERQFNSDIMMNVERDITDEINFRGIIGHNINTRRVERTNNTANTLTIDRLYSYANVESNSPSNSFVERRLVGVYGDVTFGFRNYLFLNLTGRNDWSSTLPTDSNSFFYPSANLSFVFTEAFDLAGDILSYGKLRLNAAQVGSDESPYQLQFTFSPVSSIFGQYGTGSTFPFGGLTGFSAQGTVPPTDLKPQRQTQYEIGGEFQFLDGLFGLDVTYYNTVTSDQIISLPRPPSTGFGALRTNVGEVSNKGIELVLDASPFRGRDFAWTLTTNFAKNTNRVESLADGVDEIVIASGFNGLQVVAEPGESLGLYGLGWLTDDDGNYIIDENTGLRRAGERQRLGSTDPDFRVGLNNAFRFRDFDFSFLIDWKQGGVVFSQTVNSLRRAGVSEETATNRFGSFIDQGVIITGTDDDGNITSTRPNDVPVQSMQAFWQNIARADVMQGGIYESTYVKLRQVRIGYTLPRSLLENTFLGTASVGFEARNLFTLFTTVPHIDPETNLFGSASDGQGIEWNNLPSTRQYGFNVRFTF